MTRAAPRPTKYDGLQMKMGRDYRVCYISAPPHPQRCISHRLTSRTSAFRLANSLASSVAAAAELSAFSNAIFNPAAASCCIVPLETLSSSGRESAAAAAALSRCRWCCCNRKRAIVACATRASRRADIAAISTHACCLREARLSDDPYVYLVRRKLGTRDGEWGRTGGGGFTWTPTRKRHGVFDLRPAKNKTPSHVERNFLSARRNFPPDFVLWGGNCKLKPDFRHQFLPVRNGLFRLLLFGNAWTEAKLGVV